MVYRAKITSIQAWVAANYNMNAYPHVRDAKDVYIEVMDENEAELLENMNRNQENWYRLLRLWIDLYEKEA